MPSLGRARDSYYCVAHERLRDLKRSRQSCADMRGHCEGSAQIGRPTRTRPRRVPQRLFAKQLKRVANDDKIPAAAAAAEEHLNEFADF